MKFTEVKNIRKIKKYTKNKKHKKRCKIKIHKIKIQKYVIFVQK